MSTRLFFIHSIHLNLVVQLKINILIDCNRNVKRYQVEKKVNFGYSQ